MSSTAIPRAPGKKHVGPKNPKPPVPAKVEAEKEAKERAARPAPTIKVAKEIVKGKNVVERNGKSVLIKKPGSVVGGIPRPPVKGGKPIKLAGKGRVEAIDALKNAVQVDDEDVQKLYEATPKARREVIGVLYNLAAPLGGTLEIMGKGEIEESLVISFGRIFILPVFDKRTCTVAIEPSEDAHESVACFTSEEIGEANATGIVEFFNDNKHVYVDFPTAEIIDYAPQLQALVKLAKSKA